MLKESKEVLLLPSIFRNWRVILAVAVFLVSIIVILLNGLTFGIDFAGGTLFQIHLAEKVSDAQDKEQLRSIIQQRLDFSGLRDSTVQVIGDELVFAQLAETDPNQIERLESLLLKQGKFEAIIDGNVMFDGSQILEIVRDPGQGYGVSQSSNLYRWTLPFVLNDEGARKFAELAFHKCKAIGITGNQTTYECARTYFFIDRPVNSVIVVPSSTYRKDNSLLLAGNREEGIPEQTTAEEIVENTNVPFFVLDENSSEEEFAELALLSDTYSFALVPPETSQKVVDFLEDSGFTVNQLVAPENVAWIWFASGVKQVIELNESVTNQVPYIASIDDSKLKIYSALIITGNSATKEEAQKDLQSLTILLESGSLPVAVDSISKETISPSLGKEFLSSVALMAVLAVVAVFLVLFFRYRILLLLFPILFTVFAEVTIVLGIASILSWPLDLAALTGVIAAVGTGVDDQIVITDELKRARKETVVSTSLINRAKRAFFIVLASAATAIGIMIPLLVLGPSSGMAKLVGFAFTTVLGVLVGILITRPAFQEIAKEVVPKTE